MKKTLTLTAAALIAAISLSNVYAVDSKWSMPQSEGAISSDEVKATVKSIDYKTREVTLREANGKEFSFVAGENVKNLNQVKKGDTITATYTEAVVFDIKKGGHAQAMEESTSMQRTQHENKPSALIEKEITATVVISAIDQKAPSVTFKNAKGKAETFKVKDPQRLEGIKVGDTVEVTYMQALALKVEKSTKI